MTTHLMGIGETVASLRKDFPEISVSKVRFLEAEGLVVPLRTPSGYRKFSPAHVERIRYVLRMQRDHFLPLRVIAEHLDAVDRGLTPPEPTSVAPRTEVPEATPPDLGSLDTGVRLHASELSRESGLDAAELEQAIEQGLLPAGPEFSLNDVETARALAGLGSCGLPVRNTRPVALAVKRELDLYTTVLGGKRRGEDDDEYQQRAQSLAAALIRAHVALLRSQL
ncbi:MAG: MerR family transcriptional regulator [Candidatus Nanopelagicales bacterium]